MSDLDNKIKELATTDWELFMQLMDKDTLITIKVRMLRHEGKSWLQISKKLEIPVSTARTALKKLAVKK